MSFAFELSGVTKVFGEKTAVSGLNLAVPRGSFLGLVGRNGAGKSTTLKMLTGLISPSAGSIQVLGEPMGLEAIHLKRRIGVMPEEMALLESLTGPQYLLFVGRMYGLEDADIHQRLGELFELVDLKHDKKTLVADYSYGMKKKTALCAALMHAPEIVFLDEPFEGIDPVASKSIKELLQRLQQRGTTIVLTTHILELVEKLCGSLAIIDQGQLLAHGETAALLEGRSLESYFVQLVGAGSGASGSLSWL